MKEEVLDTFDALFAALLTRGDADEAMGLFADEDVVFWGSGRAEQAFGRRALAELFNRIVEIGDGLSFDWAERRVRIVGDAAWVSAVGDYRYAPSGASPSGGPYRLVAVFVRRDGHWLWHTYGGSEPVD